METLADRLKKLEKVEAGRTADPNLPLMVRIDGRCFSKFTKLMTKPFSANFCTLMDDTASYIMRETDAKMAYNQSDEITLSYYNNRDKNPNCEYMFKGKFQKLTSVLASMASSYFCRYMDEYIGGRYITNIPQFDCRVWNVNSLEEVSLNYLWRHRDWIRNSVTMLARHHFSHKKLQGVTTKEMKEMLNDIGVDWEIYSSRVKYGNLMVQGTEEVELSPEELLNIPSQHHPVGPVRRNVVKSFEINSEMNFDAFHSIIKQQYC